MVTKAAVDCLSSEFGFEVSTDAIRAAVRRACLRGLALEMRQGYSKQEFCLPAEVHENPIRNIKLPNITTPEFLQQLAGRVWDIFEPELDGILD